MQVFADIDIADIFHANMSTNIVDTDICFVVMITDIQINGHHLVRNA